MKLSQQEVRTLADQLGVEPAGRMEMLSAIDKRRGRAAA